MTKDELLKAYNDSNKNTVMETLDIQYTDAGEDFLEGTMPVNSRVHQPMGILHGGVSAVLAETLGSMLSYFSVDREKYASVGTQITANHLRPVREGIITGRAEFIKKGLTSHLLKIEIKDEQGKLVTYCSLSTAIVTLDRIA